MDNERKTPTFDQLPQAVGELLDKVDYLISRLDEKEDAQPAFSDRDHDKVMTLDEACQFIGKARSTMYSLTSENRIPYRKCGNRLYFFKNELLEWIKNDGLFDSTQMPTDMSQAAFEAHALELRNQKKNKPLAIKSGKEVTHKIDKVMALEKTAVNAAIHWAKTDMGYATMVKAVNDYMNAETADWSFRDDLDAVRHHRKTLALQIDIDAFFSVSKDQEERLRDELMKIAEDCGHEQG